MTGRPLFPVEAVLFDDHPARLHAHMTGQPVPTFDEVFGGLSLDVPALQPDESVGAFLSRLSGEAERIGGQISRQMRPPVLNRTTTGLRPPSKWWADMEHRLDMLARPNPSA